MPETHIVKPKETIAGIAKSYGFGNWHDIYDHPANAKLREARPDPNLIHPGDKIFIPDKIEKNYNYATDKVHTTKVKAPKPEGDERLRSVTILVHGVNTDAAWFKLVETEMEKYQHGIYIEDEIEHNVRYGIIPFTWGDYENKKQGGLPNYAVDEVKQMFENPWTGYDRVYQGHSAVRLKELIDEVKKLGVQINAICHSNGTAVLSGALLIGADVDNVIFMGSPLDCDNVRSQKEIKRARTHMKGKCYNFWSNGDEWAYFKGGIGANGNNKYYNTQNPNIINIQFRTNAVIKGVKITEDEVDHSDYMLAEHMPIFSAFIREFGDTVTPKVTYDQAKIDALRKQADWTQVSFYKSKTNVTMESADMKKYESQIKSILE